MSKGLNILFFNMRYKNTFTLKMLWKILKSLTFKLFHCFSYMKLYQSKRFSELISQEAFCKIFNTEIENVIKNLTLTVWRASSCICIILNFHWNFRKKNYFKTRTSIFMLLFSSKVRKVKLNDVSVANLSKS